MSTQFDHIQVPYDHIRQKAIALIEHEQVKATLAPFIHKARVLELACGSGFYTYEMLKWGASAVVGVDISSAMIEEARRLGHETYRATSSSSPPSSGVDLIVADCAKPALFPGGLFDLVFAAWLLNHAPNYSALVDMFRNAVLNLKDDGGYFIGVTGPPTSDPTQFYVMESQARPHGSGGLFYDKTGDVEDGISVRCHGETEVGIVDMRGWLFRRDVYERAAREAGFRGELTWETTSVSKRWLEGEMESETSLEEIRSYEVLPGYGLLIIGK